MASYWTWYIFILVALDWLVVVVGVVGNILTIVALVKYKAIKNKSINLLFVNLTVADLGVLLVHHSFQCIQLYNKGRWIFDDLACKIIPPVSRAFLTVSILILSAITYQRYRSIIYLFKPAPSNRGTIILMVIIWVTVIFTYGCLDVNFRRYDPQSRRCKIKDSAMTFFLYTIVEKALYVFCFAYITYMFLKIRPVLARSIDVQKNSFFNKAVSQSAQTLKLLRSTLIILFMSLVLSWVLLTTVFLNVKSFHPSQRLLMYHIVGILIVLNSAVNPFIYVVKSRSFTQSFAKIFHLGQKKFKRTI